MNKQQLMKEGLICEVVTGSHAYGTNLPTSDFDTRGIFVAPPVCIRTPFFKVEEVKDPNKEDTSIYELTNYIRLLVDQNPNILELVWIEDDSILFTTNIFERLRQERYNLLSSKLAFTFTGYAVGQLKRMKGHHKWINNPQSIDAPRQDQFLSVVFNMTEHKEWNKTVPIKGIVARDLGNNLYGLYAYFHSPILHHRAGHELPSWFDEKGNPKPLPQECWIDYGVRPDLIAKVNVDQFKAAHENWKNYWTWKNNRNKQRSELEEKFGYDSKHAMHLVRLLRMGHEALTQHEVIVKRPDALELLDIRHGMWKYEELISYSEELEKKVMKAYETTTLPRSVDVHYAANLLMELQDMAWKK